MPLSKADVKRGFQFIEPPPVNSMRRRTPESAPRLFEWLTENGYVEPVRTVKRGGAKGGSMLSNGRLGSSKRKKKPQPF